MGEEGQVSVTEIAPRNDDFERTPPHDVAAEQCALGGMLLTKDAISDVIEVLRPADHYRPAHQLIHEAILDLYGRGEPADAITVANELTRRGEIARVGGGPYLHTLVRHDDGGQTFAEHFNTDPSLQATVQPEDQHGRVPDQGLDDLDPL